MSGTAGAAWRCKSLISNSPEAKPRISQIIADKKSGCIDLRNPRLQSSIRDLGCAGLILAAVLLMGGPGITQGGLGWSDAPNHVFDGIFVLECGKHWPIANARECAEQFYLHHPPI